MHFSLLWKAFSNKISDITVVLHSWAEMLSCLSNSTAVHKVYGWNKVTVCFFFLHTHCLCQQVIIFCSLYRFISLHSAINYKILTCCLGSLRWNVFFCATSRNTFALFARHLSLTEDYLSSMSCQYFTAVGGESSPFPDDTPVCFKTKPLLRDHRCMSPSVNRY